MNTPRSLRVFVSLLSLLLAAAPAQTARAQAAPPASAPQDAHDAALREAAAARFDEGLKLYAQRRYSAALVAFQQSYALTKSPVILSYLGQVALRDDRPVEALHYFQQYLAENDRATPQQIARVKKRMAQARRSLGRIQVSAPDGAEVRVDGETVGRAPLSAPVDALPGDHEVYVATPDAKKVEIAHVEVGETATVKLTLPTGFGTEPPPARVLEPTRQEEAESTGSAVSPAGAHETPGLLSPPRSLAPALVAGGVAVVALSVGAVLGGMQLNAEGTQTTATAALTKNGYNPGVCATTSPSDPKIGSTCAALTQSQSTLSQTGDATTIALLVGGAAAGLALSWYLFAPKATSSSGASTTGSLRLQVAPAVGPGIRGAAMRLDF